MVIAVLAIGAVAIGGFAACIYVPDDTAPRPIHVVIRNEGSGTRVEFERGVGLENNAAGASVQGANGAVITSVAANQFAIGYISGGTVNDTVRAMTVDGVAHTATNYSISRPFILAHNTHVGTEGLEPLTREFWNFVTSTQGQTIVANRGYIAGPGTRTAWEPTGERPAGDQILIRGSTSVTSLMGHLIAGFIAAAPASWNIVDGDIHVSALGTSAGFGDAGLMHAEDRVRTIAMASGVLTAAQAGNSVQNQIAVDAVAIIVHPSLGITNLTTEQVRGIFSGNISDWNDL